MKLSQITIATVLTLTLPLKAAFIEDAHRNFLDVKVYSHDQKYTHGYLRTAESKVGSFFSFDKQTSLLSFDKHQFHYADGEFKPLDTTLMSEFKTKVMPFFSKKYGYLYSKGNTKNTYVFLDYSCPYSRKFVATGRLNKLVATGSTIWVMPISRLAETKGILSYGELQCSSLSKKEQMGVFLTWMKSGKNAKNKKPLITRSCSYWKDLKPYYGIVSHLNVTGVPAVITDNNE